MPGTLKNCLHGIVSILYYICARSLEFQLCANQTQNSSAADSYPTTIEGVGHMTAKKTETNK